jgi:carboxypeptidase C (cathepsin A)
MVLFLLLLAAPALFAQRTQQRRPTQPPMASATETPEKTDKPKEEKKTPPPEEKTSQTKHSVHIGSQEFFAAEYTFHHLELEPPLRRNLSTGYYEAGHMMYIHPPSFAKLKQDIAQLVHSSLAK